MDKYVSFGDFKKLELKIGKILTVEPVEGADRLYRLEIDVGESQPRVSVAGMAIYKEPHELEGRLVPVITNLQPATMRGVKSEAMILAADLEGQPILLQPEIEVPPGTNIR